MTRTHSLTEYQFWARVLRMVAAIIGASVALWLLGGDRNPDAAAADYTQTLTVTIHDTYDTRGIRFYELRASSGAGFTLSIDRDIALSRWLDQHGGRRVVLTLQTYTALTKDTDR